jgi:hypothetical protein
MADITQLILDDHDTFRREFAALDDTDEPEQLRAIWEPLVALLDVHAAAEEAIFYPQLLRRGDDPEDETIDAIGDHNEIRDGLREAAQHPIGSPQWWDAVRQTRVANSDHMAEEEDDALSPIFGGMPASACARSWATNSSRSRPTTLTPGTWTLVTRIHRGTSARYRRGSLLAARVAHGVSAV